MPAPSSSRSERTRLLVEPLESRCLLAITVTFQTSLGDFNVELFDEATPITVANFLSYADGGDYANTIIHRSVPGFVVQGGGFTTDRTAIPTDPPIRNEPGISNVRGTVAMAKLGGNPNSATSQWFINLADNSANLDNQNGGFTVFGRVVGDGMAVVDAIAALSRFNFGGAFTDLPLRNYSTSNYPAEPSEDQYVVIYDIFRTAPPNGGTVEGTVFHDANANGQRDAGEAGLAGFRVWIDLNNDGFVQNDEPQSVTDAQGRYSMTNVAAGDHLLRIARRDQVLVTTPNGGRYDITVVAGGTVTGRDFGSLPVNPPSIPDLSAEFDTGVSSADNITARNNSAPSSILVFLVPGVLPGAQVGLFANGHLIGQATATAGGVEIASSGAFTLGDGLHAIVARQVFGGVTSVGSEALLLRVDTQAPEFISGSPPAAAVDSVFAYDAQTNEEADGVAYELFRLDEAHPLPAGMSIDRDTGRISWTPTSAQLGMQAFGIRATDRAGNARDRVFTVEVRPPNHPPVAVPDAYTVLEDQVLAVFAAEGLLSNDSDPDHDPLTAVLVEGPSHGTVALQPDGSFTYTPAANFFGEDAFVYRAHDGVTGSTDTVVSISVTAVEDPPVARDDVYQLLEDEVFSRGGADGVLGNDLDPDAQGLTALLVDGPAHGVLTFRPDGSFVYAPNLDFSGTDTFRYRVSDGSQMSEPAVVTLHVQAVNDPPVAMDDFYQVEEDTILEVAASGVLANDHDPDSPVLLAALIRGPAHGRLLLQEDGSFRYEPDPDFHGMDTFVYRVRDGQGGSAEATVTITVRPVDDPPSLADVHDVHVAPLVPVSIFLQGNDPDGGTPSFFYDLIQGSLTRATLDPLSGEFRWTPPADANGVFEFSVRLVDASGSQVGEARSFRVTVFQGALVNLGINALQLRDTSTPRPVLAASGDVVPPPRRGVPAGNVVLPSTEKSPLSRIQSGSRQVVDPNAPPPSSGGSSSDKTAPGANPPAQDQAQATGQPDERQRAVSPALLSAAMGLVAIEGFVDTPNRQAPRFSLRRRHTVRYG